MVDSVTNLTAAAPDEEQYVDAPALRALAFFILSLSCFQSLALLACFPLLARIRRDKQVQAVGYGFIHLVILGVLFGECYLGLYAIQIAVPDANNFTLCHVMTGFLLLHLHTLMAPLVSKTWRVWRKIRHAETRRLKLWDHTASKMTMLQIVVFVSFFIAHLCARPHNCPAVPLPEHASPRTRERGARALQLRDI